MGKTGLLARWVTEQLRSGRRVAQNRLNKVITTADGLYYPENAARALVGIGIAQIRLSSLTEGEHSLELALSKIPRMKGTHERQETMVDVGIAYQIAGKPAAAAAMWGRAFQLESWHYQYNRGSVVAPLDPDDVSAPCKGW